MRHRMFHLVARAAAAACVVSVLAGLSGCAAPGDPSHDPWDVAAVAAEAPVSAPAFEQALLQTYLALARQERAEGDWSDTRYFLDQARRLVRGEAAQPTTLDARSLSDARRANVAPARARLIAARRSGAMSLAPQALARAQGAFECWFQEAEEDRMPAQRPDLEACRTAFAEQMAVVDEDLGREAVVLLPNPDGSVGTAEVRGGPGKRAAVTLESAGAGTLVGKGVEAARAISVRGRDRQALFGQALDAQPLPPERFPLPRFALGATALPAGSDAVASAIMADAARRKTFDLVIVGYADTVGGTGLNRALGLRRAARVRDHLLAAGLDPAHVILTSEGETRLAVETGDNVAEAMHRRVVVTVR